MKLLVVVDYQYDFVAADGKLTAGEPAQKIEEAIREKIVKYKEQGDPIVFTMDAHKESDWQGGHPEGGIFPPHCIKGTPGYELYGSIRELAGPSAIIDKRAYCPDLNCGKLMDLIEKCNEVEVCGVVTDICVFQTVIGLYTLIINQGWDIQLTVDSNACASFNPERQSWALIYMKEVIGVHVID